MKTSHLILIIIIIAVLILGGSFALKTFTQANDQNNDTGKMTTNNTNSTVHMNSNISENASIANATEIYSSGDSSVAYTGESSEGSYYDESVAYTDESYSDESYYGEESYSDESTAYAEGY